MTTQEIAAALQRVEAVVAAPPRRRPARRGAGHGPLGGRHARRGEPRQRHADGDRHADASSAAAARTSRRAGCSAPDSPPAPPPASRWARPPQGIELASLEVRATSRSDIARPARHGGCRRRAGARGTARRAARRPHRARTGSSRARLRALVEESYRCSPMSAAVRDAVPVDSADRSRRPRDGRAVGNPARRAPGRRDLHPGAVHRALVLPVARARTRRRRCSSPAPSAW